MVMEHGGRCSCRGVHVMRDWDEHRSEWVLLTWEQMDGG